MALDADTGKVIWEYKFNIFQSDVPPHRVGWASPAADPDTGNIYALGVGATVIALSKDGKLLWDRSIGEEFAAFTTHGGRTMSPLVDGDLVIVSAAISSWGTLANRAHRFVALDKRTGDIVWVATPGGRPYDTAYAAPLVATINGLRLLICGTGDGAVHAIKPQTGEKVWSFVAAKRAVNTGVVVSGTNVIVSHGDENLDSSELGMIAAIDGSQTGDIKTAKWAMKGDQFGFSSPVIDGTRVYQIENGSRLKAFDLETGRELWRQPLGTVQKAPLVMGDGKLYVGTESGKFFIVRPARRSRRSPERGRAAEEHGRQRRTVGRDRGAGVRRRRRLARPRLLRLNRRRLRDRTENREGDDRRSGPAGGTEKGEGAPALVQVSPTELVLKPGQTVKLRAKLFDAKGRFLREEPAHWSLQGLKGTVADGSFSVAADPVEQAGTIKATVGAISGEARARVVRPLPWTETFDSLRGRRHPAGLDQRVGRKVLVVTLDGQKVLTKAADTPSSSGSARSSARPTGRTTRSRPTCAARPGAGR